MGKAFLTRRIHISAMHSMGNPDLSDADNLRIFGKCFRLHGHDYFLEITVEGKIDPTTGLICNRDLFEDILETEFKKKFSGTLLNDSFESTSGEALAQAFYKLACEKLKGFHVTQLRLQETPRNFFEVSV